MQTKESIPQRWNRLHKGAMALALIKAMKKELEDIADEDRTQFERQALKRMTQVLGGGK